MKQVPDVVNKDINEAKTTIEQAHFKVGSIEHKHDPNIKENHVISQDPISLTRAFDGSEIKLVVSLGPEMVVVPDVVGKDRKDATDILEKAGFKVEYLDDEYSAKYDVGKICKQDPEGGIKAAKESTIKIAISKGTESVQVPNVVN